MWILAAIVVIAAIVYSMMLKEDFGFGKIFHGRGYGPNGELNGYPFDMNSPLFVAFYEGTHFTGTFRAYRPGTTQNSLSKALGSLKENDTYSSCIVPNGLKVTVYQDNNLRGPNITLGPGKYPNLGFLPEGNWNDRISSLVVVAE